VGDQVSHPYKTNSGQQLRFKWRTIPQQSKEKNIVKWIQGHLERMEEVRMPKKIFTQELEGARRRGRPRKRWKEEVERDLQVLGVRRWRELVADTKKWEDIVRQAKAVGCSANGRRRRRRRRRRGRRRRKGRRGRRRRRRKRRRRRRRRRRTRTRTRRRKP